MPSHPLHNALVCHAHIVHLRRYWMGKLESRVICGHLAAPFLRFEQAANLSMHLHLMTLMSILLV